MGFWRTERGHGGDVWADIIDGALKRLCDHEPAQKYPITLVELADLVEFCTRGHLVVEVRVGAEPSLPLSKLHGKGVETYPNRGQIHCAEMEKAEA